MSKPNNEVLLQKADWALADITANGGLLNPEQANYFIRKVIVEGTLLRQVRAVTMDSHTVKLYKIGFGSRILRPATEATALSSGDRSAPTTSQVTLTSKEVIAEILLPYDIVENNVERGIITENIAPGPASNTPFGGGVKQTLVDLIAQRASADLEELALEGDTLSGDPYLALQDGYLKLAAAHVVTVNEGVSNSMFTAGLQAMPKQYLRNLPDLRHFLPVTRVLDWKTALAQRETALGDSQITSFANLYGMGVPVEMAPKMPDTVGLLCAPKNLIFGMQREITIEAEKIIAQRLYRIVLTAKVGMAVEETDALVKYTAIQALVP